MWGIIATWVMAKDGIDKASKLLNDNSSCKEALLAAIKDVEDNPDFWSVGYGGLPNEDKEVECDAAYMNGDNLKVGCVGAIKDIANPIEVAEHLSHEDLNNFLTGDGAKKYAIEKGFMERDMLTQKAINAYEEKKKFSKPYRGHDTIGCIALDSNNSMCAGTSTSGLFMKRKGRIGDSPLIGSGYYADSLIGGAAATGLGEDIMKKCMSYEIVRLMSEGYSPQKACEKALLSYSTKLKGDCSLIAMNNKGEFGAATNIDDFSFVVATQNLKPTIYRVSRITDHSELYLPDEKWLSDLLAHI
ncbi:MAG: N(4)-(beta-N-acetylglucosaminyl)-L-asparaginase [Erysipelotrichaceae bacterium]|nr:N(4)-(beta-N-acetylglucosaminyl)-L-asparaginase [Erysipelotrichaceae bacterium]